jgi:hypothetical protein
MVRNYKFDDKVVGLEESIPCHAVGGKFYRNLISIIHDNSDIVVIQEIISLYVAFPENN